MSDVYDAVIHQLECNGRSATRRELEAYGAHMVQLLERLRGGIADDFLPKTPEACLHGALIDAGIWDGMLDWLKTHRGGIEAAH